MEHYFIDYFAGSKDRVLMYFVGRPIAVDWALSKDRYQKAVENSGNNP